MAKNTTKTKQIKSGKGKIIGFAIYITLLIVLTLVFLAQIGMIGNQNNLENDLKLSQYKLEYQEQLNKQNQQYISNLESQYKQATQVQNDTQPYDNQNQQSIENINEQPEEQTEQNEINESITTQEQNKKE